MVEDGVLHRRSLLGEDLLPKEKSANDNVTGNTKISINRSIYFMSYEGSIKSNTKQYNQHKLKPEMKRTKFEYYLKTVIVLIT